MRSIIYIILVFSIINVVLSDTLCELKEPSSKKDCTDYELTDADKMGFDVDSCCYETYKADPGSKLKDHVENKKTCGVYKKKDVNKDNVKKAETLWEVTDLSVECHSNWISFSLLFLLFSLLF